MTGLRGNFLLLASAALGITLLCGFGTWQVQRLKWKQGLIAQLEARKTQVPRSLKQVTTLPHSDLEYVSVADVGEMDVEHFLYLQGTLNGTAGWRVIAPFYSADGIVALVDLGVTTTRDFKLGSQKAIAGVVRLHDAAPSIYDPQNDPSGNMWFWWDVPAMQKTAGMSGTIAPFVVQTQDAKIELRNNHLGYAITWFGLAAALAAVTAAFAFKRARE